MQYIIPSNLCSYSCILYIAYRTENSTQSLNSPAAAVELALSVTLSLLVNKWSCHLIPFLWVFYITLCAPCF